MSVQHIKVHQVDKGQALEVPGLQRLGEGNAVGVAGGLDLFGDAFAIKNIKDLADRNDVLACVLQQVQHGGTGRLQAQIVPVGGAVEGVCGAAQEGTCDDTAHAVFALEHLTGNFAVTVQFVHRHQLFIGRHLEHAVGAGVDDEGILPHGLLAIVFQHLGAGVGLVAQHLVAGLLLKFVNETLREAVREGGQRLGADHAGDLPVTDGGILAHALLLQAGKSADGGIRLFPGGHAVQVEHSQPAQVGAVEVGVLCNGTQRIGALIAKCGGIRLCADAKAVQNDQKNTFFHMRFTPFSSGDPRSVPFVSDYHYKQIRAQMQELSPGADPWSFSPKCSSFYSQVHLINKRFHVLFCPFPAKKP